MTLLRSQTLLEHEAFWARTGVDECTKLASNSLQNIKKSINTNTMTMLQSIKTKALPLFYLFQGELQNCNFAGKICVFDSFDKILEENKLKLLFDQVVSGRPWVSQSLTRNKSNLEHKRYCCCRFYVVDAVFFNVVDGDFVFKVGVVYF